MAKCRICGAPHRACGPETTVVPIDTNVTRTSGGVMGLKAYEVVTQGRHPQPATLMLSDEEAKRMGVFENESKSKKAPAKKKAAAPRKARTPQNKAAKPAANKATTASAAGGVEAASDPGASE